MESTQDMAQIHRADESNLREIKDSVLPSNVIKKAYPFARGHNPDVVTQNTLCSYQCPNARVVRYSNVSVSKTRALRVSGAMW